MAAMADHEWCRGERPHRGTLCALESNDGLLVRRAVDVRVRDHEPLGEVRLER